MLFRSPLPINPETNELTTEMDDSKLLKVFTEIIAEKEKKSQKHNIVPANNTNKRNNIEKEDMFDFYGLIYNEESDEFEQIGIPKIYTDQEILDALLGKINIPIEEIIKALSNEDRLST